VRKPTKGTAGAGARHRPDEGPPIRSAPIVGAAHSRPGGGGLRPELPQPSPRLFAAFATYSRWYLSRHFHAVRLAGTVPRPDDDAALVVYFNHPSWWDPLVAIHLARSFFPGRTAYGPIDAAALGRYGFFEKLGFFGVEAGTVAGARRFLAVAEALAAEPATALWITPEGRFTDPRQRPVRLRPGLGRLARRLGEAATAGGRDAVLLPLAVEYVYWQERFPEVLLTFGEPLSAARLAADLGSAGATATATATAWDGRLAAALETAQDDLAERAVARDPAAFEVLVGGRAGVSGVYDLWQAVKGFVTGNRYLREHGGESGGDGA